MSQEKAQLIAPLGIVTFSGVTATGVITATSLSGNITGSASSIVQGTSITAGVVTASSFAGNLTGNIQRLADSGPNISVGVVTATSFSGNLTGSVTDLTGTPAISVGVVTATTLKGPVTGDITGNITGDVTGVATGNVTGNVDGDITGNVTGTIAGNVTGNVTGNASGYAGGLGINYNGGWAGAGTSQISVGVITATSFYGDGSTLDGVSGGPVSAQSVTINGASTSIDLSSGNLIYATQSANTTVSFANSENGNVYFIRTKDDNTTTRTISWPDRIKWEGGSAPTLIQDNPRAGDAQVLLLVTRDMGVTWYGKEVVNIDPQTFELWGLGYNNFGQLAQNNIVDYSSPVQISGTWLKGVRTSDGSNEYGGINSDGELWMWGDNAYGVLGQNTTGGASADFSSPVQVGTDTTWSQISVGPANWCIASKTDGTLWSWGEGTNGSLGLGSNTRRSSPTQIGTGTNWSTGRGKIYAGHYMAAAVKTDGTLWTWGTNANVGQLGTNTGHPSGERSSPTQVGTDTTWNVVTGGWNWCSAIKTDGTLWTWGGQAENGQLGHNNRTNYSSPVQVPGTTWAWTTGPEQFAMATKTDGTLWAWGNNSNGALGLNQAHEAKYSSPVQIPGTTWTLKEFTNMNSTGAFALKTDGTAWGWGSNIKGQLGQNNTTQHSSPVQVPGTQWGRIDGGGGYLITLLKYG